MKKAIALLVTLLLLAARAFAQTNLDKPIEPQRPTIRTEIYRGSEAASDCDVPPTYSPRGSTSS